MLEYLTKRLGKDVLFTFYANSPSPVKEPDQSLYYYVNDTSGIQIIRVVSELKSSFEHIVFSKERILFLALPESYLEVCLTLGKDSQPSRIDCKLLRVNEKDRLTQQGRRCLIG